MTTPFYTTLTGPLQTNVDGSNYSLSNINNFYGSNIYARGGSGNSKVFDPTYNKAPTQTYGSFSSSATQALTTANTPQTLTYNTNDVTPSNMSRSGGVITLNEAGVYKVLTSIVFLHTNASTADVYFWLRQNGSDVANSGTYCAVSTNAVVGTVELIISVSANDTIEFVFASSDANVEAIAVGVQTSPYTRPAVPSIITTVVKLSP